VLEAVSPEQKLLSLLVQIYCISKKIKNKKKEREKLVRYQRAIRFLILGSQQTQRRIFERWQSRTSMVRWEGRCLRIGTLRSGTFGEIKTLKLYKCKVSPSSPSSLLSTYLRVVGQRKAACPKRGRR
jgi:hypothetical protein